MVVTSLDATGWRPAVYDGTGVRGEAVAFLKNDARLTTGGGQGWVVVVVVVVVVRQTKAGLERLGPTLRNPAPHTILVIQCRILQLE